MNALITGINGFVGSHLAEHCLQQGAEVSGTIRGKNANLENIKHIQGKLRLIVCDITDYHACTKAMEEAHPELIFHLAAQSFVPASWRAPIETMNANVMGSLNIFEALRNSKLDARMQIASSSEVYGFVREDELPITERNELRPLSPYGVSKAAMDLLGYQYTKSYGLKIVRTRAFNHSVNATTPIIIKETKTGLIDIKTIEEIRKGKAKGSNFQKWRINDLEVWSNNKFSKIYWLSCHKFKGKLMRLVSSDGIVEVTDNHSVINARGKPVEAKKLKKGSKLKFVEFPHSSITKGNKEIAWLYGFFAAEGDCSERKIRVSNSNKELLKKVKTIFLEHFSKESAIYTENKVYRLSVLKARTLCPLFREMFYSKQGFKKVPKAILNADAGAKLSFLRGYNAGDGLIKDKCRYEFKSFKTNSPLLALGLVYLINSTTKQRICLNYDKEKKAFQINLNTDKDTGLHRGGKHFRVQSDVIKKIQSFEYAGFVYDFETEDHTFHAGVGKNLVHNTGPRRGQVFVCSDWSRQIALIEKGKQEPFVTVGNLEAKRDFTDVRDVVKAYWLAATKGKPGEIYNICSGKTIQMKKIIDILFGMSSAKIETRVDPAKLRPSDVPVLLGDSSKFTKETGWKPEIELEQTLKDLLDYWRERV